MTLEETMRTLIFMLALTACSQETEKTLTAFDPTCFNDTEVHVLMLCAPKGCSSLHGFECSVHLEGDALELRPSAVSTRHGGGCFDMCDGATTDGVPPICAIPPGLDPETTRITSQDGAVDVLMAELDPC